MAPVPEMPEQSKPTDTVASGTDDVIAPYADNVTVLSAVEKGKADWRDYRCIELDNGVTVCLVHDATSKTTA
jgi:hypothetical protein